MWFPATPPNGAILQLCDNLVRKDKKRRKLAPKFPRSDMVVPFIMGSHLSAAEIGGYGLAR
jgi:hypothetical protein